MRSHRIYVDSIFCFKWTIVLCAIVATPACAAPPSSWSSFASYPTTISNNAIAGVCEGNGQCTLYSFMGMTNPAAFSSVTPAAYKLRTGGIGWTPIADAPLLNGEAKVGATAIACGGEVYLIGGYTIGGPEVTEPRLFRYDDDADEYVELAEVPTEVDDTVAAVYQDRYIYLISGWHGPINNNVTAVQFYDTVTNIWQQATPIPAPGRFGHAGGIAGNRLVIIDGTIVPGGFVITHSTLVGEIDPDDPTAIDWTSGSPNPGQPTYRAAASLSPVDCNRILFVGGTNNPYNFSGNGYNGQPANPLDQVMTYNPFLDAWTIIDDTAGQARTPTMDHRGLARFNDRWVTVGGMTAPFAATTAVNALLFPGAGDFNGDGVVTLEDHEPLTDCLAGPDMAPNPTKPTTPQDCLDVYDCDTDGDVDLDDAKEVALRISPE